ncbi:SufS family cysteine desulfurase [bacterium]|nr:SufS family cysteine desulfurase [bacterium]MBU1072103.1 SufS family cysteine desulfurase [bacterium]MBU1674974.1 SufS family cysteine desulfurase [bacterium]
MNVERHACLPGLAGADPCQGQQGDCVRCGGIFTDRFPVLRRSINGHKLVYLDNAATTQKPESVIAAEARYYRRHNANVHRGMHALATEATELYESCRRRVALLLGVSRPEQVVITGGTTASLNLAAFGLSHHLNPGDEILLTEMEHHANLVPWIALARREGLLLRHLPLTADGGLDLGALPEMLSDRTRIVSLAYTSNVLGTINPVAEIAAAAHRRGAIVIADAAQAVGHLPLDFAASGVDLLAFSAHKAYGPMGLGFLVGTPDALARLEPVQFGGEMIDTVSLDEATWAEVPHRFEAGTPNVAAAAAFPAALDLLGEAGLERIRTHEIQLTGYALEALKGFDGLTVYGPDDPTRRGGLVSFHDERVHAHDLAQLLDARGVAIRAGHHCAQPLHGRLGVTATARASFGIYNSHDDIDAMVEAIAYAREVFA